MSRRIALLLLVISLRTVFCQNCDASVKDFQKGRYFTQTTATIPKDFYATCHDLVEVNLNCTGYPGNCLYSLDFLDSFGDNIKSLSACRNQLYKWPNLTRQLGLEYLNLDYNYMNSTPDLGYFPRLLELSLQYNSLQTLLPLNAPQLKKLKLSYNKLTTIESGTLENARNLVLLDLENNQLVRLDLVRFRTKVFVYLDGNPKVVEKSTYCENCYCVYESIWYCGVDKVEQQSFSRRDDVDFVPVYVTFGVSMLVLALVCCCFTIFVLRRNLDKFSFSTTRMACLESEMRDMRKQMLYCEADTSMRLQRKDSTYVNIKTASQFNLPNGDNASVCYCEVDM